MKQQVRTLACGAALAAAVVFTIAGCGGKQTMASKSAAAYDEARKKGIPVSAGEHGGHTAESPPAESAANSFAQGTMPGMDHNAMPGMDHSQMRGMNHAQMPGMQHGGASSAGHDMAGMKHGSMAGMDHSTMPGMQHGTSTGATHDMAGMTHGSMPGMQHAPPAAPIEPAPPRTNAAIAQTQPATTLRTDAFDAPAPSAVNEAAKAGSPKPPSEHHDHDGGDAS